MRRIMRSRFTIFVATVVSAAALGCGPDSGAARVDTTFGGPDDPTVVNLPMPVPTVEIGQPFPSVKCQGWVGESFDLESSIAKGRPILFDIYGEW